MEKPFSVESCKAKLKEFQKEYMNGKLLEDFLAKIMANYICFLDPDFICDCKICSFSSKTSEIVLTDFNFNTINEELGNLQEQKNLTEKEMTKIILNYGQKMVSKTEKIATKIEHNIKKSIKILLSKSIEKIPNIAKVIENMEEKNFISGKFFNDTIKSSGIILGDKEYIGEIFTKYKDALQAKEKFVNSLNLYVENIFRQYVFDIKEQALDKFISLSEQEQVSDDNAFHQADTFFIKEMEAVILPSFSLSYKKEKESLLKTMRNLSKRNRLIVAEKIKSAEQQAYSYQLLQQLQAQLHNVQQQQFGGTPTLWNIGIAYRPPESFFNISAGYQQGKTNIQITMIPDEYSSLLGSTGFTAGVGPGNLGLSLNLNI